MGAFQYLLYQWAVVFGVLYGILGLRFSLIIVETFLISITALSIISVTLGIILPKARLFFCAAWIGACSMAGLVTYAWVVINREYVVF